MTKNFVSTPQSRARKMLVRFLAMLFFGTLVAGAGIHIALGELKRQQAFDITPLLPVTCAVFFAMLLFALLISRVE